MGVAGALDEQGGDRAPGEELGAVAGIGVSAGMEGVGEGDQPGSTELVDEGGADPCTTGEAAQHEWIGVQAECDGAHSLGEPGVELGGIGAVTAHGEVQDPDPGAPEGLGEEGGRGVGGLATVARCEDQRGTAIGTGDSEAGGRQGWAIISAPCLR